MSMMIEKSNQKSLRPKSGEWVQTERMCKSKLADVDGNFIASLCYHDMKYQQINDCADLLYHF